MASVFFSAYWIVNAWLSLDDQRGEDGVTPFLVVLSIVSPFSITSFLVSLTLFSLVSNFHRLQVRPIAPLPCLRFCFLYLFPLSWL